MRMCHENQGLLGLPIRLGANEDSSALLPLMAMIRQGGDTCCKCCKLRTQEIGLGQGLACQPWTNYEIHWNRINTLNVRFDALVFASLKHGGWGNLGKNQTGGGVSSYVWWHQRVWWLNLVVYLSMVLIISSMHYPIFYQRPIIQHGIPFYRCICIWYDIPLYRWNI